MRGLTLLVSAILVTGLLDPGLAWSKDGFIDSVLSQYRESDQASRADSARDGIITEGEFVFSLYGQADARGNNDNQVSREEFIDYYSQLYNISSELATIMFDYLNDPASRDDVITTSDVSLSSFAGRTYATVAEYRDGLEKWLRQSLEKLYSILMSPHVINGDREEPMTNYNGMITSIDTNKDGTISIAELNQELQRFNPNQPATRTDWVWRNSQRYGGKYPDVSSLAFDFYDRDSDLKLTSRDLRMLAEDLDYNGDGQIKKDETLRFMERAYSLSQRMTGRPMSLPLIRCPQPWWSEFEPTPSMEALRAAVDFDDDLDGWITASDLRRWLDIFDSDDNSGIDVSEYTRFNMERYGLNSSMARIMFDLADSNGDGRLNEKDWEFHFKDDFALSLCDARRSILDLARMGGKFQGSQLSGQALRAAMQRKLREEWAWYQQRRGGSWGRLGASWGGAASRDGTCRAEELCYNGEYTEAWGRPGAWMWWGIKETQSPGFRPGGFPGQAALGNTFPGVNPFFPPQNTPLLGGNAPLFGQFQFPAGSDSGLDDGMMSQFMPFKRNALSNSADPDSSPSPKREMAENHFTHYQKLFTPFVPSQKPAKESEDTNSSPSASSTNRDIQSETAKQSNIFEPPKQKSEPSVTQNDVTTARTLASSPETPPTAFTEGKADGNSNGFNNIGEEAISSEELPFMGYPVFIGFDPWFLGAAPAWGMVGRMKRGEEGEETPNPELSEETRYKREVSGESGGQVPLTPSTRPDGGSDENNSTRLNEFSDLGPAAWSDLVGPGAPPLTFGISPIDFWTAIMLENAMLNSAGWAGDGDWLANQTETNNETHFSPENWWLPEFWAEPSFEESVAETGQEQEKKESAAQSEEETKSRRRRFAGAGMYRDFYFPNYANPSYIMRMRMMRNMMRFRRFFPTFSRTLSGYPWSYMRWQRQPTTMPYTNRLWMMRYPYSNFYFTPKSYWMKRRTTNPKLGELPQTMNVASGSRLARAAESGERNKRWQDGFHSWYPRENRNWYGRFGDLGQSFSWQNRWSNRWMGSGQGDNYWKRDTDEDVDSERSKRDADSSNREKRWEKMMWLPMRYMSAHWKRFTDWQGWDLFNPLNRWPFGSMMNKGDSGDFWKRDAQEEEKLKKVKREVGDESREKRWQNTQMSSSWYDRNNWQRFSQFNRYWPMTRNMPNGMNPQWNSYWKRDAQDPESLTRSRRNAEDKERAKRWHQNFRSPQSYGWYGWPQHSNNWQNQGWGMNQWQGFRNWDSFWKRDAKEEKDGGRFKREAKPDDRKKRWNSGMWSSDPYWGNDWQFYSGWNNNRQNMFGGYNHMPGDYGYKNWRERYGKRDASGETSGERVKRQAVDGDTNKSKRSYMMWNYEYPFWNRGWPQWQTPGCYPYCGMFNNLMYKRDSEKELNNFSQRGRRSVTKKKRQGMFVPNWSPSWGSWSSQWSFPYNNWQAYQWQTPYSGVWKRNAGDDQEADRVKRDTGASDRKRRFGVVWNWRPPYWNSWAWPRYSPYHYNWFMLHRFRGHVPMGFAFGSQPWKRSLEDGTKLERSKREAEGSAREKRYRMWSGQYPQWNRWSDQWGSPWDTYGNMHGQVGQRWNSWGLRNQMWKRNTKADSEQATFKRDTEDATRQKRFKTWSFSGWPWQWGGYHESWQRGTPLGNMPFWSNNGYQMWKRELDENQENPRTKRDAEEPGRSKRFGGMREFQSPYGNMRSWHGNFPYNNQWFQRWGYFGGYPSGYNRNFMWKRDAQKKIEPHLVKRDTSEEDRKKRMSWNSGNPYSNMQSWQSFPPSRGWYMNQGWNSYKNMPNQYYYGNNMWWKRDLETNSKKSRTKRNTETVDRGRRNWMPWNFRSPFLNREYQSFRSSYPSWQYNNQGPYWSGYSDYFWKREAQDSDSKTKREADKSSRGKRFGNYWSPWYSPYTNWYMNQDWNSYNFMPYTVSHMWKRDSEDSETTRTKRDAEDKDRAKRQMTGSSMWPWQNRWSWDGYSPSSNWNQYYNMPFRSSYEGGQYWKRDTEDESQDIRSKRSADEMGREKRNMVMNWPNWNNWYSQYMWNRPYGWHDYDFPMWKRNSDQDTENSRSKRDAEELEREKRQENFGWPWQWYSHQGPNFAQHMWNPHFRRGNSEVSGSHMSKREFSDEMFHSQTKRDTTGAERKKRFKIMWNSGSPWQQSYPYNDWNTYQSWQPSWFGYGSSMWRRDSEENNDNARSKRDTENVNRKRRFGMVYDWDMPWQRFNSWNPYYMSNWFSYGNHMWKREGDEDSMANRERRDTGEAGKEKRQGSVGNSWSGHGFSRPWRWNLPSRDWQMYRWNNFNSWPGWNSNFYSLRKRHGDLNVDGSRTRREANEANREKRYGGNWNSSPYSWNWSWNFPYNNWFRSSYSNWPSWSWRRDMWKRGAQGQSGDVQNENVSRNKRDVSEENRNKRYAMMWSSFDNPWSSQWYYPSSEWYMPDWFGGNGFWKRETQDSSDQQERTRRDTGESNKVKRQGMMSPHWGGGFSQSYYPSNNWDMHSNWNSYNGFSGHWAYGTNRGWKRDTEKRKESSRIKREADDTARTKRMGEMMWDSWPWQWQSPWWRPSYYWGRGMWKREEQGGDAQFREKREVASGDEDKWMTNMKDRKAEPSKRQYSYNKKTSGSSKTMNSEDSVWRSAKKSYDEQNSWQRRLDQENSNWHHGTNKWGDKAVPNTYSTASWMQTPTTGRGYSWQSAPSSYPSGGYNRAGGMRTNSMPSGWYGGVHMGGDSYGQPYNTQWRSMYNGDAAMSGYWPVDWDNAFGPYGIYGFSPLSMRLFREAQAKREAQDSGDAKSGIDESETLLPQKRHAEESKGKKILDRKKRFSHFFNPMFNFYKYQKMRQMRASWFFHSFCQRPAWWGPQSMGLFKRNATNTDKEQSFFNPTKQTPTAAQWLDSEKEKRQGRLYNNPGSGNPFPGTQNRNRFQMWQFYAWMCPRAWHVMQGNFISPGGFSQGFPINNFPQGTVNPYFRSLPFQPRWKRSTLFNPSGSTGGGYNDARDRRQWGNYWRGWPRGHGPEDCEEWVSPMPAWSPWRGWNMLRKNRGETSSTEAREKREADQDKRAAYRCRNWHGGRFYDPNMNMGMGNRMSPNRFGMDSWRSNWMDANRWGSRRYRRETPSGGDGGDTSGREKRWQEPGTWFPGYGPPQFGPWSHFNFWSQW